MSVLETEPASVGPKPPPASLSTISVKGKAAGSRKTGDLTRLFELAHKASDLGQPGGEIEVLGVPATPADVLAAPAVAEAEPPAPAALDLASTVSAEPDAPLTLSLLATPEPESVPPVAAEALDLPPPPVASAIAPGAEILPPAENAAAPAALPQETRAASEREPLPRWFLEAITPTASAAVETTPQPVEAPAPEPVEMAAPAPEASPEPAPTPAPLPQFSALVDYWRFLRGSHEFPAASQVERSLVSERWPSSILLAFASMPGGRGEPELAQVTRLGRACADAESAVDYSPYATRWMLELGRAALRAAEPVEEIARLSTASGSRGFRLVALPLGPADADPDSVLCELAPTANAPRFGKRRVWLED